MSAVQFIEYIAVKIGASAIAGKLFVGGYVVLKVHFGFGEIAGYLYFG
jgi:hypothetical protein